MELIDDLKNLTINDDWIISDNKYQCPYCKKLFSKKGICSHLWKVHGNGKTHDPNIGYKNGSRIVWNKGLTKETDERVKSLTEKMKISLSGRPGHPHSEQTKKRLSEYAKQNNFGGHTSKNQIFYKTKNGENVYLQSSWEIKVAKELDKNNINWIRPKFFLWEDCNKKEHRYYPDFYLIDYNIYLDPKNNFLQLKDKIKIDTVQKQNNIKILILSEYELTWEKIKEKCLLSL